MKQTSICAWIRGLAVFAILSAPCHGLAQSSPSWTSLPGQVLDIAINDAARAYAVSNTGEALRWRASQQRWSKMSGKFVRITGAEGNHPWGVTAKGVVQRFNGLWWEPKGTNVVDVAGDAVGNILTAGGDGVIRKWEPLSGNWRAMSGLAKRIALDERGNPWVVAPDNSIYRYAEDRWQAMPGVAARDIAVGGDGTAIVADMDGSVRVWNADTKRWESIEGIANAVSVAVTPNGGAWAIGAEGSLHARVLIRTEDAPFEGADNAQPSTAPQVQAPSITAPAAVAPTAQAGTMAPPVLKAPTSQAPQAQTVGPSSPSATEPTSQNRGQKRGPTAPNGSVSPSSRKGGTGDPAEQSRARDLTFTDTGSTASRIEIGKDGSVFVLITGGSIRRWSNERRRLEDFPGQLTRLAVDTAGNPWGITGLGRVFYHNGQTWKQIVGATASDIAIGADGSIVIATANSTLARFNPLTSRFDRIPGRGVQVAVAPDGTPWTIRTDNVVQSCDRFPCTSADQLARNISIGPDGSVFLVSTNDQLLRKRPGSSSFERVLVPGHTPMDVAVGPQGFPWIVSDAGKVISSKFFARDESNDRKLALQTATTTIGTGATSAVVSSQNSSAFTFTKNLKFESYRSGDPDANLAQVFGMAVGQDDSVFIRDNTNVFAFNARKKKFEALTTKFPAAVTDVSTDADGNLWGLKAVAPATVYRIRGTQTKSYTVISSTDTNTPRNMAVDGDGTVYVAIGNQLYRKQASASRFRKFSDESILYVALAGAGDIWIMNQSSKVQQWTGTKFENRPVGTAQSALDIAAGADGTVYIVNSNKKLMRWNATNSSFDEVSSTATFDKVGVTSEGRPWAVNVSSGGDDIFRAKD